MTRFAWLALLVLTAARSAVPLAATPIARLDLPVWRARYEQKQAEIAHGRFNLIYYGDSITQNFEHAGAQPQANWPAVWQRFYADRRVINLGFKGDTTASLLWRIEHGEGDIAGNPKAAIVLIGANNFGRLHWSPEDTLLGIQACVAAIHRHLPATKILLLSVLPSQRSPWVTQSTQTLNTALARTYAPGADPLVTFIDVSHTLMTNGHTDVSLFIDPLLTPPDPPLHPTAEGATRVAEAIEPTLSRVLGDRRH